MNHDPIDPDGERELFARLEADMTSASAAAAVDASPADSAPAGVAQPLSTVADDAEDGPSVYLPDPSAPVMVDRPAPQQSGRWAQARAAQHRPVLPVWARSKGEFLNAASWLARHLLHSFAFHAVRTPWYGAVLAARAPVGMLKTLNRLVRWAWDAEGEPARQLAASRNDPENYLKLSRQRDARVKGRWILLLLVLVAGPVLALVAYVALPTWAIVLTSGAVVSWFGFKGTPKDKPVISRAVLATKVERLTSHTVERALGAMGIAEINKALAKGGSGISFPAPITRDGPGWRADVDLPYGVTAVDIMERRDRLASGLRRPLGCVWPEPAHDQHAGRLVLWVGDQDMSQAKPAAWPLSKGGAVSLFKPIPFGSDQRGRTADITLMFANALIGAMPRFGKTFALRVLMLAAALDPTAELHVWELKGTGDLEDAEKVATDYGSGPDDDTIEAALGSIRYVYKDLERRAEVIRRLPKERRPENKVTPELAADKSLGLHPLVLIVDECQELFSHSKFGKEAGTLCEGIIKRGPAMGVILLLATQRPDKDSLPTGVSANVGIRFCLRVMGQLENDMVLGTSAYKNGLRATTFTTNDKGIGYLVGAANEPQIVRSFYIDGPAAGHIMDRARAARIAAGTLTGIAAGHTPERETNASDILDDLAAIWPGAETRVWSENLVAALAELDPARYGHLDAEGLAALVAPYGIRPKQIGRRVGEGGKTVNRRGLDRDDLNTAITKRDDIRAS